MSALPQQARLAECESTSSLMVRVLLAGFHYAVPGVGSVDVYPMHAYGQRYTGRRNGLQSGRHVHEPIPIHQHRSMAPSTDCFPMTRTRRERPSATVHRRADMAVGRQWAEVGVTLPVL